MSQAEFDEHNQSGMAREDPQGHRWCSAKLLFDYTPYATREDWLGELTYQRWMWENLQCRRRLGGDRSKDSSGYAKDSEIWKHFQPQELAGVFRVGEPAAEQLLAEEPYGVFGQRNDWARNGIAAKLRQMPRARREKHYAKVHSMAQCWPVPPAELLWVGGTYARSPDLFPAYQQEHAWVYGKLRPLGIQPDSFLSRLHQTGVNRFAPIAEWCKTEDAHAMPRQFPGTLPDAVRAGKLWTHIETHKLHESLWHGHKLRNKHKPHTAILDHPLADVWNKEHREFVRQRRPLHLLTAPAADAVRSCAASRGFLDAEVAAAGHASASSGRSAAAEHVLGNPAAESEPYNAPAT